MEQLTLPIITFFIPTALDLEELWLRQVAPNRWGRPEQTIYWHGPGLAYEPAWTTGNWGECLNPATKEDLKRFLIPTA